MKRASVKKRRNPETEALLVEFEQKVRYWTDEIRKVNLLYKRRMDFQRQRDRENLMKHGGATSDDATTWRQRFKSSNSAMDNARDVTSSLKRTRQIMLQQVERAQSASTVLGDGQQALKSTNAQYQQLDGEMDASKAILTDLERQARADKMWILAGLMILLLVISYILYQRIGFRLVGMYISWI